MSLKGRCEYIHFCTNYKTMTLIWWFDEDTGCKYIHFQLVLRTIINIFGSLVFNFSLISILMVKDVREVTANDKRSSISGGSKIELQLNMENEI